MKHFARPRVHPGNGTDEMVEVIPFKLQERTLGRIVIRTASHGAHLGGGAGAIVEVISSMCQKRIREHVVKHAVSLGTRAGTDAVEIAEVILLMVQTSAWTLWTSSGGNCGVSVGRRRHVALRSIQCCGFC